MLKPQLRRQQTNWRLMLPGRSIEWLEVWESSLQASKLTCALTCMLSVAVESVQITLATTVYVSQDTEVRVLVVGRGTYHAYEV
jgi:hypothetical protein